MVWKILRSRGSESVDIGKVKGHATDEMVRSGKVQKRDQVHNDTSDINATKGIEDHGEGVAALAKELAAKRRDYKNFIARLHQLLHKHAKHATSQMAKLRKKVLYHAC